jgi:hypothetical protein
MGTQADSPNALADRIRRAFPPSPVPPHSPLLGLDPFGEDEYAAFANVPWPDVPAASYRWVGYDIPPVVGMRESPHAWSYYFPGFMTAALLHENTHPVLDALMWQLRAMEPPAAVGAGTPWWAGEIAFANYTHDQVGCVVAFLRFVRDHDSGHGGWDWWEPPDDLTLQRWLAARG